MLKGIVKECEQVLDGVNTDGQCYRSKITCWLWKKLSRWQLFKSGLLAAWYGLEQWFAVRRPYLKPLTASLQHRSSKKRQDFLELNWFFIWVSVAWGLNPYLAVKGLKMSLMIDFNSGSIIDWLKILNEDLLPTHLFLPCEPNALASGFVCVVFFVGGGRSSGILLMPDASAITLKSVPKSMLAFLCGCCSAGQNDTDPTTANAEKG